MEPARTAERRVQVRRRAGHRVRLGDGKLEDGRRRCCAVVAAGLSTVSTLFMTSLWWWIRRATSQYQVSFNNCHGYSIACWQHLLCVKWRISKTFSKCHCRTKMGYFLVPSSKASFLYNYTVNVFFFFFLKIVLHHLLPFFVQQNVGDVLVHAIEIASCLLLTCPVSIRHMTAVSAVS